MSRDNWETDGDWTGDPWFLRDEGPGEAEWESLGFPLEKRRLAAEGLARIFPAEVCRSIRDDPSYRGFGPVILLFGIGTFPGMLAPLLRLGINAMATKVWEDSSILHRLRNRRSYRDAAFEVRLHAGLLRNGFQVIRIPEARSEKRCDFQIRNAQFTYDIEAKLINSSNLDGLSEEMNKRLRAADLVIPGLHLTLLGSESLAEQALDDSDEVSRNLDQIVRSFHEVGKRIREHPTPGRYRVGDHGEIIAKSEDGFGACTDLTLPDLPEEKKASRIVRKIRDGLSQLTGKNPGIVVVGVFHSAHPFAVERLALASASRDEAYKRACMIVLCDEFDLPPHPERAQSHRIPPGRTPTFYAFSPRPYRRLRKREMDLAAAAASTHERAAVPLRPAQPGEYGITLNTKRPTRSVRSMGSVSFKPGQSVTMYMDGRPPLISDSDEEK